MDPSWSSDHSSRSTTHSSRSTTHPEITTNVHSREGEHSRLTKPQTQSEKVLVGLTASFKKSEKSVVTSLSSLITSSANQKSSSSNHVTSSSNHVTSSSTHKTSPTRIHAPSVSSLPSLPALPSILSGMKIPEKSDIVAVPIGDLLRNPDYQYWESLINRPKLVTCDRLITNGELARCSCALLTVHACLLPVYRLAV